MVILSILQKESLSFCSILLFIPLFIPPKYALYLLWHEHKLCLILCSVLKMAFSHWLVYSYKKHFKDCKYAIYQMKHLDV